MVETDEIHYGDIWYADVADNTQGLWLKQTSSIQEGMRPFIIVSNEACNFYSSAISVVPLTHNLDKTNLPTHCVIHSAPKTSIALCELAFAMDKKLLVRQCGELSDIEIKKVKICLMTQFNII